MNILTANEVKKINASKAFEQMIERICQAHAKGMYDLVHNNGYLNEYANKSQNVAYDLGWNKAATIFPTKPEPKEEKDVERLCATCGCTYTYDSICGCQR